MHLAQFNVARLVAPLDDPRIADFVAGLDLINALADSAPGFVWRLQTEEGDATSIRAYDDDRILLNYSVWETIEDLRSYVYQSGHFDYLRRRREWFEPNTDPHLVMWWIEEGVIPTVEEGVDRLSRLRQDGPSPQAFTFRHVFDPA